MTQLTVALFSSQKYEQAPFNACLNNQTNILLSHFEQTLNEQSTTLCQGFDAVCVFVNDVVNSAVISQLADNGIKLILLRCAGFNNVDLKAAKAHNITVCRVPAYSPEAVAEHCVALMLTLNRKTHKAYNRIREDNFDLNGLLGFNLFKKTIGIIGCGEIGQALVNIINGFGANLLVCDPYAAEGNYTLCDIETLLNKSDVISLNCPLNEQTHHLINENAFSKMKKGVMLINTSRGALVDSKACINALKSKKLGYLGLDVYEQESELFFKNRSDEIMQDDVFSRLVSFPNVLVTGHQGFFTQEALSEIAQTTINNALEFANNQPLSNEVK